MPVAYIPRARGQTRRGRKHKDHTLTDPVRLPTPPQQLFPVKFLSSPFAGEGHRMRGTLQNFFAECIHVKIFLTQVTINPKGVFCHIGQPNSVFRYVDEFLRCKLSGCQSNLMKRPPELIAGVCIICPNLSRYSDWLPYHKTPA